MINLHRLITRLFPDRRPDWEQKRERDFIVAANGLKTLRVSDRGGMSIDPEELREQIVAAREQLKHLVPRPGMSSQAFGEKAEPQAGQGTDPSHTAPYGFVDCIEVVAWRRRNGTAVRYACLQSVESGRIAVATASLFLTGTCSLPPWVDANANRQVAEALSGSELRWFTTVSEAMDNWDAALG